MISINDVGGILAAKTPVRGNDGKIGTVGQVFLDDSSNDPTWMTVNTGLFGTKESFVPLEGASYDHDEIVVPFTKDLVKDAPRLDVDESLSPEQESELFAHYGLQGRYAGWDQQPGVADQERRPDIDPAVAGGGVHGAPPAAGFQGAPAQGADERGAFRDDRPDSARPDVPTADGRPLEADVSTTDAAAAPDERVAPSAGPGPDLPPAGGPGTHAAPAVTERPAPEPVAGAEPRTGHDVPAGARPTHADHGAPAGTDAAGQATGRVRLRRYTVTETFAEDGTPVTSEDIHIERDPEDADGTGGPGPLGDEGAGRHSR
ncbi:PRC-barrel domain-containing protein [Georgenia sp. Z1491]|uniref:PRC-barrel domain-containing protein n=1 Tax=Georgenia sp. Z1491 TaxID=3416707 RepID=UPI003CFA8F77